MRLGKRQVDLVAAEIACELLRAEMVAGDEERVARTIARAIHEDLVVEDTLDEEVAGILEERRGQMRADGIDYSEMFERIKRKLARDRKLVL